MNFRILAKMLGALILLQSIAMFGCGIFSWLDTHAESNDAMQALLVSGAVLAIGGGLLMIAGLGKIDKIPKREGLVIVSLGWIVSGVLGGIPYVLCEPRLEIAAAIFESVSGFTTTGSTVMSDIEAWPRGILMWRSVTQWLGGMGILVLFVALLSYLGLGSKSLFRNESSFQTGEVTTARIRDTAMSLWNIYIVFTIVSLLGLKAMGLSWFNATCHAFTTIATGGFSPHNASIGYYYDWDNGWLIELWTILFMVLSSISYLVWLVIFRKRWKRLKEEEEGKMFLLFAIICILLTAFVLVWQTDPHMPWQKALRDSAFTIAAIISTTGYASVDYEQWPAFGAMVLAMLMVLGGCAGSTSGGVKMSRFLIFIKTMRHEVVKAFRPHQVFRMKVNGNSIDEQTRSQTMTFIAVYAALFIVSTIMVAALEATHAIDIETCVGSVIATLLNIGPGFGDVGPTENFSQFQPRTLIFFSLLMILGRLELFAVLALFLPSIWKRY